MPERFVVGLENLSENANWPALEACDTEPDG